MKKNILKLILPAMCLFGALFASSASAGDLKSTTVQSVYYSHEGNLFVSFTDSKHASGGNNCDKWYMLQDNFDTAEKRERIMQIIMAAYLTGKKLSVRYSSCIVKPNHTIGNYHLYWATFIE